MGRDKALVELGGIRLIERVIERFAPQVSPLAINANGDPSRFAGYGLPILADDEPDTGPLGGILAGMRWAQSLPGNPDFIATVPVDTPFAPTDLVAKLDAGRDGQSRIVIAASGDRDHPVVGLWPVALADALAEWRLTAKSHGVRAFIAASGFTVVHFPQPERGPDPFLNANTPDELAAAAGWLDPARLG
ncbi:molybdenum cofactor guanylyltransferase [Kaistia sp. 32K]|uniref:molybdenum cofactor guanylyltransferase n=1 Tax=Kaistia sp. 32K TaxID=2795690 RepID=UPI001937B14F|nr:molybdenum cofactor guanylyltransferase [Kaistia sp. 32K]BCP53296.1 molybdenum cofactor guanylyltransferase [Kaistia sp. 32K]